MGPSGGRMGVSSESTSISLLQIVRIIMIDVSLNVYVKKNRYHNMNHASSSCLSCLELEHCNDRNCV